MTLGTSLLGAIITDGTTHGTTAGMTHGTTEVIMTHGITEDSTADGTGDSTTHGTTEDGTEDSMVLITPDGTEAGAHAGQALITDITMVLHTTTPMYGEVRDTRPEQTGYSQAKEHPGQEWEDLRQPAGIPA